MPFLCQDVRGREASLDVFSRRMMSDPYVHRKNSVCMAASVAGSSQQCHTTAYTPPPAFAEGAVSLRKEMTIRCPRDPAHSSTHTSM